jgi:hypothetical protein
MASDSRVSGGVAMCYCDKVFRIRNTLVGVCGDNAFTTKWLEWFRRDMPPVEELMDIDEERDFLAIELNAEGIWLYTNTCEPDLLHEKFYAIGSGSMAAMGALYAGKSAVDAIKIASLCDEHTGGKIRELLLLPAHKEKTAKQRVQKPIKPVKAEDAKDKPAAHDRTGHPVQDGGSVGAHEVGGAVRGNQEA